MDTLFTRAVVLEQLCRTLPGRNLFDVARENAITIYKEGKRNKGWVGQTIERAAGLSTSSRADRDGLDFELKSTRLWPRGSEWAPQETIKVTQLNPRTILDESFLTSTLWRKLERLIFVGYYQPSEESCLVVQIRGIDLLETSLVAGIEAFWNDVRQVLAAGEIAEHHDLGKSGDLVQLRPTGNGKQWSTCPVTGERFPARAFYATKRLIRAILVP